MKNNSLTPAQREAFLEAFRATYKAADQGETLRALYARFAAKYGIEVAALRRLASNEVSANARRYVGLARKRQASRAAPKAASGGSDIGKGAIPDDPPPAGTCGACGELLPLRQNGTLRSHRNQHGVRCPGVGRRPARPKSGRIRRSVYAIGGGLPTLGRPNR